MGRNFGYESATKHALVAFGLMVFWFIIYVIASTYAGSDYVPHTPGSDYVPSRLFAAGGVFGMQRPMIEVWRLMTRLDSTRRDAMRRDATRRDSTRHGPRDPCLG